MNLIIIVADSLRRDHLGAYGNAWIHTPHLDRLAKESIMFTNAVAEGLPTIPFRRALHTGCRTFPFDDYRGPRKGDMVKLPGWQPLWENDVTVAEILSENGYLSGFITDTYHQFKPSMNFHRGFDNFLFIRGQEADRYATGTLSGNIDVGHYYKPAPINPTWGKPLLVRYFKNVRDRREEKDYFAPRVFQAGMDWIGENRRAGNFFLLLDSFDPHEPWDPPRKYADLYDPGYRGKEIISPIGHDSSYLTGKELNRVRALYAGEVTMFDHWLGKFLRRLEKLGLRGNTLLVFIADHGIFLGEHGIIKKAPHALYPQLTDLPFFIRLPGGRYAGRRVSGFAQNHDVLPTVLYLLGIKHNGPVDGMNLWPLITGRKKKIRDYVTCAYGYAGINFYCARDGDYLYIRSSDRKYVRLYDLKRDPGQRTDVAGAFPAAVKRMEKLLQVDLRRYGKRRRNEKC